MPADADFFNCVWPLLRMPWELSTNNNRLIASPLSACTVLFRREAQGQAILKGRNEMNERLLATIAAEEVDTYYEHQAKLAEEREAQRIDSYANDYWTRY